MDNGDVVETSKVENEENIRPGDLIDIKVTHVSKLQEEEGGSTPVSSAGEDDDAPDFQDMLKEDSSWVPPSEEVEMKIRTLLEQYFSNENLTKDKFLLKHVKRNKQGYVSVKLLTSFKKIKNHSKDWRMTAYAVLKSDKLEINRIGTKLHRRDPLPEIDLPATSIKTVLYKLGDGQPEPSVEKQAASDNGGSNNSTPSGSPWLQRRRMLAATQAANSPSGSPGSSPVLGRKFQDGVPDGVVWLPKGPPNSNAKGFDGAWKRKVKTADIVKNLPNST